MTLIKLPRISLYLQAAASSARLKGGSARLERSKNSRNSADKTTRLLVGILVLFLMAEVPQVKWLDIGTFELGVIETIGSIINTRRYGQLLTPAKGFILWARKEHLMLF